MESLDRERLVQNFGLTNNESLIFLELLNNGPMPIGKIIKKTNFHRGTVYNTLQRLIDKGCIAMSKVDEQTRLYSISESSFLSQIFEQEKQLELNKKLISLIKKRNLENKNSVPPDNRNIIEIYYGNRAYKDHFLKTILDFSKKELQYSHLTTGFFMMERFGVEFYKSTQNLKKEVDSECKALIGTKLANDEVFKKAIKKASVKYLPSLNKINCSELILDDKVIITNWGIQPLQTIIINSKEIAAMNKIKFKTMWKNSGSSEEVF